MRDIEGIEEAMEVLRPHWNEIEEEFNRRNEQYLAMAVTDHEAAGRVLRAHLIVENFLNRYLVDLFGFEDFSDLRLTFSQKAKMLPKSRVAAAWVRPGIVQLNNVRNKYSHNLDHDVDFNAIGAIMEVLSVSRPGYEFITPLDAIEAFAPVACAFLTVPPQHLSDAFSKAFRHMHTATPDENE